SPAGTVSVNRVAKGSGAFGTNSTLAEPIHRHSPSTAGLRDAGGGSDFCSSTDIRATTGPEKVMVGRASAPTTSCGREATTVRPAPGTASGATEMAGGAGSGSRGAWVGPGGLPLQAVSIATESAATQARRVDAALTAWRPPPELRGACPGP